MQQFKVPQDVQREDTIIGPITLRQMIILGFGGGIAYAIYISLAKTYFLEVWLPPVAIVSAITLAFAFLKVHSLPFHLFLMAFIEYKLLPNKRVWIEGSGYPFISPFEIQTKKTDTTKTTNQSSKPKKSLKELINLVDRKTANLDNSDIEKKNELKKIINQNY